MHENRTSDRRESQHGGRDRGDGILGFQTLAIRLTNQLRTAAGGEGFKGWVWVAHERKQAPVRKSGFLPQCLR